MTISQGIVLKFKNIFNNNVDSLICKDKQLTEVANLKMNIYKWGVFFLSYYKRKILRITFICKYFQNITKH